MSITIDFNDLKIKVYNHWTLYLNEFQCYLGRLYLVAKRDSAKDFIEMLPVERDEFFKVASNAKRALSELFQPDLMNYASLGNNFNHLHVHLIPRYAEKRVFGGIEFFDKRWGSNYAPYDRDFNLPLEDLLKIRDSIKASI